MFSLLRDPRAVALLLAAMLTILSNTLISPALPGLLAFFHGEPDATLLVRILVTAPSLVVAVAAPVAGFMADWIGRRRQLLAGMVLFAATGTAGLWLPTLPQLLISRLALGLAVALIMTAQTALIADTFSGDSRVRFMGLQMAATNFGGFVFLLIAGRLAGHSPFLPFALYGVALLFVPLICRTLREPEFHSAKAPLTSMPPDRTWIAVLTTVITLATLCLIGFYLIPTQAPFFLIMLGYSEPSAAATMLASLTLAGGVMSLCYANIRKHFKPALTLMSGFLLLAIGFALLGAAGSLMVASVAAVLIGSASGLLFPTFIDIVVNVAPSRNRGLAAGAVTTSIFLGQFISPLVGQSSIARIGYAPTFYVTSVIFIVTGLIVFMCPLLKTKR